MTNGEFHDLVKTITPQLEALTIALEHAVEASKEQPRRKSHLRVLPGGQAARKPKRPAPGGRT